MIKGAFSNLFIQFLNKKNYRDIVLNLFRIANLEEDEALVDACIRDVRFGFLKQILKLGEQCRLLFFLSNPFNRLYHNAIVYVYVINPR